MTRSMRLGSDAAQRVAVAVASGFLLGVFARSLAPFGISFAALAALLAIVLLELAYFRHVSAKTALTCALVLVSFGSGVLRMQVSVLSGDQYLGTRIGGQVTIVGTISDEPDVRENSVRVPLVVDTVDDGPVHTAGMLAILPAHTEVAYGDRVRISGTMRAPEAFDTALGRMFNYPAYLAKDGIGYEIAFARIDEKLGNGGNPLKALTIAAKRWYVRGLDAAMPEPEAGLAAGITVGEKRGLGDDLSQVFRIVGLVHVIVLSGYNITLVIKFVQMLFARLPRGVEFAGTAGTVVFFVVMSGSSASAVRASAMALLALYAARSGRVYSAPRVLLFVAAAMVLWNPFVLAFDPGFQLSALATLGLVLFCEPIAARLTFLTARFGVREVVATTLATQATVLPLLLYQNGLLSLVSLPVNILTLAVIPAGMFLSFVAAVVAMLVPLAALFAGAPAYAILWYVIEVARLFASLPFAAVSVAAFPAWVMFAAYGLMFGSYWFVRNNAQKTRPAGGGAR